MHPYLCRHPNVNQLTELASEEASNGMSLTQLDSFRLQAGQHAERCI